MANRVAMPFYTLSDQQLETTGWCIRSDSGDSDALDGALEHWEYGRNLSLSRAVGIAWEDVADALKLKDPFALKIITRAATGKGALARHEILRSDYLAEWGTETHNIELEISGDKLSEQLVLMTDIVLARNIEKPNAFSPYRAGDRLWSDRHTVVIDGDQGRFPMEAVSFSELFLSKSEASSFWYLQWSSNELDRDFQGAACLLLNSDFPEFIQRVKSQDELTLQLILSDIVSQMCEHFIYNLPDYETDMSFEKGTVGAQISHWLSLAFVNADFNQIRSMLLAKPGQFRAALQSAVRF